MKKILVLFAAVIILSYAQIDKNGRSTPDAVTAEGSLSPKIYADGETLFFPKEHGELRSTFRHPL